MGNRSGNDMVGLEAIWRRCRVERLVLVVANGLSGSHGSMLEGLRTVNLVVYSMSGIAGGLEHFEAIAGVGVDRGMRRG
jgi:hypothetical protein